MTTSLVVPNPVFINESFDLKVNFSNTAAQIYYLPAIEIYADKSVSIPSLPVLSTWNGSAWSPITTYPGFPNLTLLPGTSVGDTYRNLAVGYSSYGPTQPVLEFVRSAIISDPGFVIGNAYQIKLRGLFLLGDVAYYDPILHPTVIGPTMTYSINPVPYSIRKSVTGYVGNVQPLGPAYPLTVSLDVHVAPSQTISELIVQDPLDPAFRYLAGSCVNSIPLTLVPTAPPLPGQYFVPTNNGTLIWNAGSVTGLPTTGTNLSFTFKIFAAYYDFGTSNQILNSVTPADSITRQNIARLYNQASLISSSDSIEIALGPLSLSKANLRLGSSTSLAGDYLRYTVSVSVSNYFGFRNLSLTDLMSAGQTFIPPGDPSGNVPYLTVPGLGTISFLPGDLAVSPVVGSAVPPYMPTTQVVFTLPNLDYEGTTYAVYKSSGSIPNDENIMVNNFGSYVVDIVYFTQLTGSYVPTPPLVPQPNNKLSPLDYVTNDATIQAYNINIADGSTAPNPNQEMASSTFTYPGVTIQKSFYAYNGVVGTIPSTVNPNDLVTWRLLVNLPVQNFVGMSVIDYLPPPIVLASSFTGASFPSLIGSSVPPAAWGISFGPSLSIQTNSGTFIPPIITISSSDNSLIFNFGTFQDLAPDYPQVLDILLTSVITLQPFMPGLTFNNQGVVSFSGVTTSNTVRFDTVAMVLGEPDLQVKKSCVDASDPAVSISNRAALVSMYGPVGSLTVGPGFTPNNAPYFNAFVGSNAFNVQAGNVLRYVILVHNVGNHPAYDITLKDFLTTKLSFTALLRAFNMVGASIPVSGVVVGNDLNLTLTNPIVPNNTAIIIYEISVGNQATSCDTLYNEVTITSWSNQVGGQNFVTTLGLVRQARSTVSISAVSMALNFLAPSTRTLGDIVDFTLVLTLPVGTASGVVIAISTPTAVTYAQNTITATPSITYTNVPPLVTITPTSISYNFGTLTNTSRGALLTITFKAGLSSSNLVLVNGYNLVFTASFNSSLSCQSIVRRTIRIIEPNILATKSINPLTNGLNIYYDIVLTNNGTSSAYAVRVVDLVPVYFSGGFTIVSAPPYVDSSTPTQLDITLVNPIAVGASVTITITSSLNPGTYHGTTITNIANITYKSLNLNDGTQRNYVTSAQVSYTINPRLVVNLADITYPFHNVDFPGRTQTVGAVGDRMNYTFKWYVPPGTENINRILMTFADLSGLIPEAASGSVIKSKPNTYDGSQLEAAVIITGNLVSFEIRTIWTNPTSSEVLFEFDYYFRISNSSQNTAGTYYDPSVTGEIKNVSGSIVTINPVYPPSNDDFYVVEPLVAITKTGPTLPVLPSGTLSYNLRIENITSPYCSSGFEVVVDDTSFNQELEHIVFSSVTGGNVVVPGAPLWIRYLINKLLPGQVLNIPITATLAPGYPKEDVNFKNIATITCRSIITSSNDTSYARTGIGGVGTLDDYWAISSTNILLIVPKITKTLVSSSICEPIEKVTPGQSLTYQVLATFPLGLFTNLVVTDIFQGLSFSSFSYDTTNFDGVVGSYLVNSSPGTITITFDSILVQGPKTSLILNFDFIVTANPGEYVSNEVFIPVLGRAGTCPIEVVEASLYLIKKRLTEPVVAGQPVCYEVTIGHTATSQLDAQDLILIDVPTQGTLTPMVVTFDPPEVLSYSLNPLTIPILPLGVKAIVTYCLTLPTFPNNTGGNTCTLTYEPEKQIQASNTYTIGPGILSLTKTGPQNSDIGDTVMWSLSYANVGHMPLTGVTLTEPALPPWLVPILGFPSTPGWTGTGPYTFAIGDLAPGQAGVVIFSVKILDTLETYYTNTATISSGELFQEASSILFITSNLEPVRDLGIFKRVISGTFVLGSEIRYAITVTNTGTVNYVGDLTIQELVPFGTSWNGLDGWTLTAGTLSQDIIGVNLAPGQSVEVYVSFIIQNDQIQSIINVATVLGSGIVRTTSLSVPVNRRVFPPTPTIPKVLTLCCPPPRKC